MIINVRRYKHEKEFTIGRLYIDGQFECYTLEDQYQAVKVMHETRIPEGKYKVELRTFGGHHEQYKHKFPEHKGMLWVKDVPGFKDILIHIGNSDGDTSGCLLVGCSVDDVQGKLFNSTEAYKRFYRKVLPEIEAGKEVFIKYEKE